LFHFFTSLTFIILHVVRCGPFTLSVGCELRRQNSFSSRSEGLDDDSMETCEPGEEGERSLRKAMVVVGTYNL
jgi:hypothetical protein